jgi:eukaryotic-like serine/threonine-protein kinase
MAVPPHVDRSTFLTNLRLSGLLSAAQLDEVLPRLPDSPRGRVLARALVEQGLLTRFQAEQLLAGRNHGYFLDQYRILDQLGQGGMGRVFKAEHRSLGRVVAIKVLSPRLVKTGRAQELFLREIRAIGKLVHPNIVTAFDASRGNGRYYLVLEYVNGPNLDELVQNKGPLPVGQACDFIRQVAVGLQYAHQMGLVHRDIKPANLLLHRAAGEGKGQQDVIKISDFGLARLTEKDPHGPDPVATIFVKANTLMGTPDFLSPEQARDLHQTDIRSDLYSLGCTFYYLLTGSVPFPGCSMLEKLMRHGTEMPTPVEEHRRDVPPGVLAILNRLIAKNPADRFQTPAELGEALAPFAVSSPAAWSGVRRAVRFNDETPTPVLPVEADSDALLATVDPGASPTPVSGTSLRGKPPRVDVAKRRWRAALFTAVGIVGGLLGALCLVAFFLSGK